MPDATQPIVSFLERFVAALGVNAHVTLEENRCALSRRDRKPAGRRRHAASVGNFHKGSQVLNV